MMKRYWFLCLALVIILPACQPATVVPAAGTAPAAAAVLPTASPTTALTATPAPSKTLAPTATFTPTITASPEATEPPPVAPTSAPLLGCFASPGVPFAILPDNRRLLLNGDAGIFVTDLETLNSELFLPNPSTLGMVYSVTTLSPDGERLAVALNNFQSAESKPVIEIYRIADGKRLNTFSGHDSIITELEFSPDGEKLYSASHDTWVRVWDRNGSQIGAFQPTGADDFPNQVLGMGVSADGKMLVTVPFDGKVKIWSTETFKLIQELGGYGGFDHSDTVFSPDGKYLAATTANGLFLWRISDGAQILGGNPGINAMVMAFTPNGSSLVYWDVDQSDKIIFRSLDDPEKVHSMPTDGMMIWTILFSPDGSLIAAGANSALVSYIWRLDDGVLLYTGKTACP